jgi:hypothetical protein
VRGFAGFGRRRGGSGLCGRWMHGVLPSIIASGSFAAAASRFELGWFHENSYQ